MKTAKQVASEMLSKLPAHLKGEIVKWSAEIDEAVYNCMIAYAKEVLKDWDMYWKEDGNTHCKGLVDMYIKKRGL